MDNQLARLVPGIHLLFTDPTHEIYGLYTVGDHEPDMGVDERVLIDEGTDKTFLWNMRDMQFKILNGLSRGVVIVHSAIFNKELKEYRAVVKCP